MNNFPGEAVQLVRIEAPHFVAGLEINASGYVVNWPPILRWTAGKTIGPVLAYLKRKKYKIKFMD